MEYEKRNEEEALRISDKFSFPGFGKSTKEDENKEGNLRRRISNRRRPVQEDDAPQEDQVKSTSPGTPQEDHITITMLGHSGSGKTMFLSGVYQSLIEQGSDGICLVGDDERQTGDNQDMLVTGQIEQIALSQREIKGRGYVFPVGTNRTTIYPLKLLYQGQEVSSFDFMDYAGGELAQLLRIPEDQLNKDQKKLKDQLKKSDPIMIFADAAVLARENSPALCRNEIGLSVINQIYNKMRPFYKGRPVTVLLVLTKVDAVPPVMRENHYAELFARTRKVFGAFWDELAASGHQGNFGVIPVTTVGMHNKVQHLTVTEERDGKTIQMEQDVALDYPEPENMDAAIIYAVASILKQKCWQIQKKQQELISMKVSVKDENIRNAFEAQIEELQEKWERYNHYAIHLTTGREFLDKFLERHDDLD